MAAPNIPKLQAKDLVVSGQGVQAFVEPTRKACRQKLVLGKELAIGRSPHAPHRTLLLPE